MCRLMFIPAGCKVSRKLLRAQFDALEHSCGGDGNGYFAVRVNDRGQVESKLMKGLKLSNGRIVREVYPLIKAGWSVYYHTRKVSVGWLSDEQCHPFAISGRKFKGTLVHNGTWFDGHVLAKFLGVGSDTAALAKSIGMFGIDELEKRELFPKSGVFLLFGGHPTETPTHRVLKLSGDLEYCPTTGAWASEFCAGWVGKTYNVENGRHSLEKPAPKEFTPTPISSKYSKFNGGKFRTGYNAGGAGQTTLDSLTSSDNRWTYVDRGFGFHS